MKNRHFLNALPKHILIEVSTYLDLATITKLCLVSKNINTLFQRDVLTAAAKVLQKTAFGLQAEVEMMVTDADVFLQKARVTDKGGRTFYNISPLQYAAWALDTHMLRMMVSRLSEEQQAQAYCQLEALDQFGSNHGSYFDITPLLKKMECYYTNYSIDNDFEALWAEEIGELQRRLPAQIVNEYCRLDRTFQSPPEFNESNLPREFKFYNYHTRSEVNWYNDEPSSKLGRDLAVFRSDSGIMPKKNTAARGCKSPMDEDVQYDAFALEKLVEVKLQQRMDIKANLRKAHEKKLSCNN